MGSGEGGFMLAKPVLSHILVNDALTRGLADPEARILVEWLVDRAEQLADGETGGEKVATEITRLCRRARSIGRFVSLWCHDKEWGAAVQLAGTERFPWPLPCTMMDPCELMEGILSFE